MLGATQEEAKAMAERSRFDWFADWKPPRDRDPVKTLRKAAKGRDRETVEARTEAMIDPKDVSTFYRGAAAVMASDLGCDRSGTSGLEVHLSGDAHLGNFGMFGSPERTRVFDLNDFDEARIGPWEWDVCRLAASAVVVERDRKRDAEDQMETAGEAVAAYARTVAMLAAGPLVGRWYTMTRCDDVHYRDLAMGSDDDDADDRLSRAQFLLRADRKRTQAATVSKLTKDGKFIEEGDAQTPLGGKPAAAVRAAYADYRTTVPPGLQRLLHGYEPTAVATRRVGQGSLGLRNYLLLLVGDGKRDALILQVKEATPSQLDFGLGAESARGHEGQRVVELQRAMQGVSDPLLGWTSIGKQQYYVRQFRDMKSAPDFTDDDLGHRDLVVFARLCGTTLARAHARSAAGASIDDINAAIGVGKDDRDAFRAALVQFGCTYAGVSKADQKQLRKSVR
jgi:uncharacterized protein (DUF2252 family)